MAENKGLSGSWQCRQGTVLFLDLAGSTPFVQALGSDDEATRFFDGPFRRYEESVLTTANGIGEGDAVHSVQTTGDGYTLVAKDAWAGFRLAMALQGACDRFAHDVRSACLSDELEFHQQRLESGFDFETRIGVATDRLVSRGSEHTGPVFFRAARITDKARPDRGVFSPLFDERTKDLVQDQAKDWRFFLVGDFDVDSKSGFERPLPVLHAGSSIHQTRLYSAVATGGPLAPLAERFDEAIRAYYKQRSIRAMKHFGELRRELENDATSIEAGLGHGGEIVLRRWRAAIRHFSYLPLAGGR